MHNDRNSWQVSGEINSEKDDEVDPNLLECHSGAMVGVCTSGKDKECSSDLKTDVNKYRQ